MRRRRPTGRFFVLITLLIGIVVYAIVGRSGGSAKQYEMVISGTGSDARYAEAVIMRDETVASMDGNSTMVFVASEGQSLRTGDEIAYVYSAGYSAKEMEKLESIRQDIRAYHASILSNIVDTDLDRLDDNVHYLARQLKLLVSRKSMGNLINLEAQLKSAMQARQEYLRQNRREDTKLNSLYEDESKKESAISSWRSVETAVRDGVVSFYLDGYEQYLSPDNLSNITIDGLRDVLNGRSPDGSTSSRLSVNIYRLVDPGRWYVLLLLGDASFNPVTGQSFRFQMEGFEDVVYESVVESILKADNDTMVLLSIDDPIGPLINQRSGRAIISAELTGLLVPANAIVTENSQTGVYVYDGADGAFVPVQVISREGSNVLVTPVVDGTLIEGNYVQVR